MLDSSNSVEAVSLRVHSFRPFSRVRVITAVPLNELPIDFMIADSDNAGGVLPLRATPSTSAMR